MLLFAAFGANGLYQDRSRIRVQEHARLDAQARIVGDRLGQEIDTIYAALETIRSGPEIFDRADPAGLTSRRLQSIGRLMPGVESLWVVDKEGTIRAARRPLSIGQTVAGQEFFRLARDMPVDMGVTAGRIAVPGLERDPALVLFRPVRDSRGDFDGLVVALLNKAYTATLLASAAYASDMQVALVQADGNVLVAVPSGMPVYSEDGESDRMLASQPLRSDGRALDPGLNVKASRAIDEIYATWRQRAMGFGVIVGLLSTAGVAVLWLLQRRRLRTERAEDQRLLEERSQAERLDFMLAGADVGLWDWNVEQRSVEFNERWHAMLGIKQDTVAQDPEIWFSLIHPEDIGRVRAAIASHWEGESDVHEAEYRMRHRNGKWIWILDRGKVMQRDANGAPLRMVGAHMDVTQHKRSDEALRLSEARFRALTELSSDWYWELDELHRFVRFEGYSGTEIGLPKEDNIGLTRWDLGALNMGDDDWAAHRKVLDAHEVFHDLELQRLDTSGTVYWVSISGAPIFNADGRFRGYRGIGRSITERKRVEDEIERLAFYDALTGLPNRRLLLDRLMAALATCRAKSLRGALLFIDLDNFKDLNDTMGHDVGDSLLERVANRLVTCVKPGDTVARLGGDEFVVMLEALPDDETTAHAHARGVGERVLSVLNHPYLLEGYQHHSTPSLGIALFDGHVQSVDDLLKRADLAMYQAKAAGRNTLCFFHPDMQQAVIERSALEGNLRNAIGNGEMLLYYQPVVDHQAQLTGAEALLRWRHPVRGMVSPGEFIPLAEQTGLILRIGQWVLESACEQLVQWAAQPETVNLTIAVNVSAREFRQVDFAPQVLAVLDRTGARGDRLKLELTESLLLNDVEDIIAKMGELKKRGVGFSLDDFGTGYSSLSYLKRLPLDQLKIDQSFVRDVLTDPNDAAIVRTILALAESLDLAVVAEGVETVGQLDFLTESGCRAFQGYLFGRPAPVQVMLSNLQPVSVGH